MLLARTVQQRYGASWGLSETGATGPTGNPYGDAAGHSCLAVAGVSEQVVTLETGQADRPLNMRLFSAEALRILVEHLSR
jgi:nicotinamide mononucleotide (NMN) deamidase PncC